MGNILRTKHLNEIKDRLADLRRDDLPFWGKMNVGEMICHTTDQVRMALGEMTIPDRSSFRTRVIWKRLILSGIRPPKGKVETMAELNPQKKGSKPTNFDTDRELLVKKIEEFVAAESSKTLAVHPVFGKLSKRQWGKLIYSHLNHHLNQFGA